jgi:predicted HAD superfamily hydrolase
MDDKEKIAEIIRLLEELKFQEKIVLGYTDKEMIELFRGKIKEIKKVVGVTADFG